MIRKGVATKVAFNDIERQQVKNTVGAIFMAERPPIEIRPKLDFGYRIVNQSVELFEVCPGFFEPDKLMETPVAKLTYVKTQKAWKLYWMRQDLKWHAYEPLPQSKTLEMALKVIMADEYGCFFG